LVVFEVNEDSIWVFVYSSVHIILSFNQLIKIKEEKNEFIGEVLYDHAK